MGRKGKMLDRQIDSKYLVETMTIKWYLPESFSPLYKYNVCIMQDGNDYFQLGRIATLSDRLHSDGEIENTVFVGIHYNDKYDRQDKYHPDGTKQTAYIQFLLHEVVPLLDEELPTYHVGGSRALIGDSLAGTLALMTALKYPNTFGKVIMQSPYVDEKVFHAVQSAKSVDTLAIYHTIGDEETDVPTTAGDRKNFLEPNRKLRDLIERQNTNYVYHELEGNHTWKYWQKDLKRALVTMFNG